MERGDEVLLWLMDDEYALEPISARALLDARAAAREILPEDADETDAAITQGAFIAAAGLRKDGKAVFSSGSQVLEALTAEEILVIAGYYQVESPRTAENSSDGETDDVRAVYQSEMADPESLRHGDIETGDVTRARQSADTKLPEQTAASAERTESYAEKRKRTETNLAGSAEVYREMLRETERTGTATDMRGISDFFRRDCRRYSGAYERY